MVTMLLSIEVQRILRLLSQDYMTTLPSIPLLDIQPDLAPDTLPISCMVWNVQGEGSRAFTTALKEVMHVNKPNAFALLKLTWEVIKM